ncbi:hypothetical protein MM188_003228 [Vibrio cholerae]|nr:hypothetical protein [Vibrio cholerae]
MATTNIWKQFQSLMPESALLIVEVVEVQGTRSKVKLRGGSFMWVNGASVAVGSKAQLKNGVIIAEAKNLPVVGVEV